MPGVPGSIPGVFSFLDVSGAAQRLLGKIDLPQNYIRGPRILMFV